MEANTDIAIIGGGLASFAAAVALKKSGLEVTLIRKAPGAVSLSSGAWDLCNNPLEYPGEEFDRFPSLEKNISALLKRRPHHPFQVLDSSRLQEKAREVSEALPLMMEGDASNPLALLTDMGTVKATGMVPASFYLGDFRQMKQAKVLIVGIEGLASFNARFLKLALEEILQGQENPYIELVGHLEVRLQGAFSQNSLSPFELAQALETEENFVDLGKQINQYLKEKIYTHLFLPPVLGMIHTPEIMEALTKITGRQVAELVPTHPGVPGWRLSEAILRYFKNEGFDVLAGEVMDYEEKEGQITALNIHRGQERMKLRTRGVILATGKFIGGGIRPTAPYKETLFGLPLWVNDQALEEFDHNALIRDDYEGFQPWRALGIRVNERSRPVGIEGQALFENLFAAGQIIGGWDPGRDRCSAGVSILSGTIAGESLQKYLQS